MIERDKTISHATFELRRNEVFEALLEQRIAVSDVVHEKTGMWRKLRLVSVIVLIPTMIAGIWLSKPPYLPYGVAIMLVFAVLYKISDWKIKSGMSQLGAKRTVSEKRLVRTLDGRIFKGRDAVPASATFTEIGFSLQQDKTKFSAEYDDDERIGIIFERNGILQITPGDGRDLPDALFLIPLAVMPNAGRLMDQLRQSPSFVFPRQE